MGLYLVFIHVAANVVWIGSILAVAVALLGSSGTVPTSARGTVALELYKKLATPAFFVSFLAGAIRLFLDTGYYFSATKFMHGKLTFALVVIGLHHVIGARARKVAGGQVSSPGNVGVLGVALFAAAICAVFFVVVKPF